MCFQNLIINIQFVHNSDNGVRISGLVVEFYRVMQFHLIVIPGPHYVIGNIRKMNWDAARFYLELKWRFIDWSVITYARP